MKPLLFFLTLPLFALSLAAQTPQGVNYQAVARNNAGDPIPNQAVTVNFKIRQSSASGSIVFEETQNKSTDACGLFNLKIGQANIQAFGAVDWSTGPKFLEVTINGTVSGTTEILSVPYALYAEKTATTSQFKYVGPPTATVSTYDAWVDIPGSNISAPSAGQYLVLLSARVQSAEGTDGLQFRVINAITNAVLLNTDFRTGGGQESQWSFSGLSPTETYKLQVYNDGNASSGTFLVNRVQIGLFRLY